jgi:hypothetical protein
MKVTMLRNPGLPLLKKLGALDRRDALIEKAVVEVPNDLGQALIKCDVAQEGETVQQGVARTPAITGVNDQATGPDANEKSDVADLNVTDATDAISRMRSKEKLQAIADTDKRSTVQQAAKDRLAAL